MYAHVKYVYEAPKNGQTVVIAAQRHSALSYSIKPCYWLRFYHVIERFLSLHIIYFHNFVYPTIWYKEKSYMHT